MKKILKKLFGAMALAGVIGGAAIFALGCNPDTPDTPNPDEDIENPNPDDDAPVYDQFTVNLASASATQEYKPSDKFTEGYYVFRSIESAITLTDGDEEFPATFNVSGYSSVLVYYTPDTVYDVGTASSSLEFGVIFSKLETDGKTADTALGLEGDLAVVLNPKAGESVYLHNPDEVSIIGTRGGYPLSVSGENYSATVGSKTHTTPFLLAGGKVVKVSKAGGNGATVLYCSGVSNGTEATVGGTVSLEIELLERTIVTMSGSNASVLWSGDTAQFRFTAENAGKYTLTVTSNYADDKIAITNIVSKSSVMPALVSSNAGETGDEFEIATGNPYVATYNISADNIDASKGRSNVFSVDFISGGDYSSLGEGYKITYTIKIEYSAE